MNFFQENIQLQLVYLKWWNETICSVLKETDAGTDIYKHFLLQNGTGSSFSSAGRPIARKQNLTIFIIRENVVANI